MMKFKEFYERTEQRLNDSILSLWATGDAETQKYLRYIFQEERLLAEPVFQTTFPWESFDEPFSNLNSIFEPKFIDALNNVKDEEYRFPKDRFPYKHQVDSWNTLLKEKKSIAVTTGTGSGKTECFMLPVLYDIYKNFSKSTGVNAIFLYPLNALISSQKKRIDAWTKVIGGINYGIYNGNTKESNPVKEQDKKYPEIISRELIRKQPPQILFTNPTMLEYILVRNKDAELLNNSKGKLRWILLDEAHTLTGSAAAEMALLIRRVLDAFEVTINDVRFAATSATVGNDSNSDLQRFMSGLCGISEDRIKIIQGKRYLPKIEDPTIDKCTLQDIVNSKDENRAKFMSIHALRKRILEKNALKVSEIAKPFNVEKLSDQLHLVDVLSETNIGTKQLFPVRGHFFVRGIGGVFICTNSKCGKHGNNKPSNFIGTISTIAGKQCKFCGFPLLELVACRSCGKYMLYGEQYTKNESHKDYIQLSSTVTQDAFLIESEEDDEEITTKTIDRKSLFVAKYSEHNRYIKEDNLIPVNFSKEGELLSDRDFVSGFKDEQSVCPHCGEHTINPIHFRISSSFLNRILSDIILEQTPEANEITEKMLWNGHKYISFTDSRQGTAKVSALINIDNERNWLHRQIFHNLSEKRKNSKSDLVQYNASEIEQAIKELEAQLLTCLPILKPTLETKLNELKNAGKIPDVSESRLTWKDLYNKLLIRGELKTLFFNSKRYENEDGIDLYLKSLLFDQFAKRLPRERSLENLGLVNIVYPVLDTIQSPEIAKKLNINDQEWQSLLKISVDYIIRNRYHFYLPPDIRKNSTSFLKSIRIYPNDSNITDGKRWPKFDRRLKRQNRLSLLICAGLGLHSNEEIDNIIEDDINELLENIWSVLRRHILTRDGDNENDGFKMNIEEIFNFELAEKLWLCPVKNRLIDQHFKGYTPWISGHLTEENISHFRVGESITFPYFQFPFNLNADGQFDAPQTKKWIEQNCDVLKEKGLWNNLHERIIQIRPLFLAGEHSAQQSPERLQKLEANFEKGKINILSCSTTMEMGVDIGGISVVVMNNVPPSPANYLQRSGRAGRRAEQKSLTLTFCAANPIGSNAMDDPMWALNHKIASPMLTFNSPAVVERHINAFFLGKFVQDLGGMIITETIEDFFFNEHDPIAYKFQNWLLTKIKIIDFERSLEYLKDKTPLHNKTPMFLLKMVVENFKKILEKTQLKKQSFDNALKKLSEEFGEKSPAYKSVKYQYSQYAHTHVIKYLAEEGFIPSAGMPTGVVNFDTTSMEDLLRIEKNQSKNIPNPSYHIVRALSEFAPGNNIIIDGWNYVSAGILLKSEWSEARRDIIQSCTSCGYQRIVEIIEQDKVSNTCPHCENNSLKGLRFADGTQGVFTELIEPSGFTVDLFNSATRIISEISNVQYVEPLLIGVQPWTNDASSIYDIRESQKNAEILYYNMGNGNGYSICLHCGKTGSDKKSLEDHKRLRGGKDQYNNSACSGNSSSYGIKDNIILGGRFKTDFCEIRFKEDISQYSNDEVTMYSLGVVLTKTFTSYLGIEENELSFGIKKYDKYQSLFIFDNARGGAGYSVKFSFYAEDIFNEALLKLKKCSCETACTKCLIDRSSQWYINRLDRNRAIQWLEKAIKQTVPKELKSIIPNLQSVLGSIKEDIRRVKYRNDIDKIWFWIDNNIADWDVDNSIYLTDFKNSHIKINLVLNKKLEYANDEQNRITAIKTQSWADFYLDKNKYDKLKPLCQIQLKDGKFIIYYSEDFDNSLSENWGISTNGYIYKTDDKDYLKFESMPVDLPESKIHDIYLSPKDSFKSTELAKVFLKEAKNSINLKSIMQNQRFDIIYSDRYLKSPLSCLLLIQFITGLKSELNFDINLLKIKVSSFKEYRQPNMIYNNYYNSDNRDNELIMIAENNHFSNLKIKTEKLPHYRILKFSNNDLSIIVRPDGGIEHGWYCAGSALYSSLTGKEKIEIKRGIDFPILYSIVIERHKNSQ